jgi:hypothetical protein
LIVVALLLLFVRGLISACPSFASCDSIV